ncbi:MAG: hypothetical protein JWN04_570, partial [Myxococcaceae bacterium]|nr:hypothetical protein [Myxococcaceae bacterium]
MTRFLSLALAMLALGCTVKSTSKCPDDYSPDNADCAWYYCHEHPSDPVCADAAVTIDASSPALDASRVDASDAQTDSAPAAGHCRTASDCTTALPFCSSAGLCVQCTDNTQCPLTSPTCNAGACGKCTSSAVCV